MDYNAGVQALRAANLSPNDIADALLSQSFLRLEQPLVVNKTSFRFPILVNDGAVRNTEKRLNLQDAFYMSTLNIYLCKAPSATSSAMLLDTYPNPVIFATSGEAVALETFYNGVWSLNVNNTVIVPGFDLMSFRQARQTQLTGADDSPIDQFDGTDNVIIQPNPIFSGQRKNYFQIDLPDAVAVVDANVYMVVIMRGVLAQNVTVVS